MALHRPDPDMPPTRVRARAVSSAEAGGAASTPSPRAAAASSSSAASSSARPARQPRNAAATPTTPSMPTSVAPRASRSCGNSAGSNSPVDVATRRPTALAAAITSDAVRPDTRVARWTSSPTFRHPCRVVRRSGCAARSSRSITCATASLRSASAPRRSRPAAASTTSSSSSPHTRNPSSANAAASTPASAASSPASASARFVMHRFWRGRLTLKAPDQRFLFGCGKRQKSGT